MKNIVFNSINYVYGSPFQVVTFYMAGLGTVTCQIELTIEQETMIRDMITKEIMNRL